VLPYFPTLSQPTAIEYVSAVNVAARSLGIQLEVLNVSAPAQLDGAFAEDQTPPRPGRRGAARRDVLGRPADIVRLAGKARAPAIYWERAYAEAGGLLSYAASLSDIARLGAALVDKILDGANPANLPVQQPTNFEFVINKSTAKALGLAIPSSLLRRADHMIE
jgi:putative ABC transport system substrate-binding protein